MKTFKITLDDESKIIFYDNMMKVQIDEMDFSDLDLPKGHNVRISYTILEPISGKVVTNLQFKKKLSRTMNKILRSAIKNEIKARVAQSEEAAVSKAEE